jgi:hypothetical protein
MTCIRYVDHSFHKKSRDLLDQLNLVLAEFDRQGFTLTVRQLYYQAVARALLPENTAEQYDKICTLVKNGRLAGLIDWGLIEDRGRSFTERNRWDSPADILDAAARDYHQDMWRTQAIRPWVVVEKDALTGILEPVCHELDVPLLAARGYASMSAFHEFALERLNPAIAAGQRVLVLHLGDHDPSGIDMTRDLTDRIALFTGRQIQVNRLGLNFDQVQKFNPPSNFAKDKDSRTPAYTKQFGSACWELDALAPAFLANLVRNAIEALIDWDAWDDAAVAIASTRKRLQVLAEEWQA